jgi:hypothetical protein
MYDMKRVVIIFIFILFNIINIIPQKYYVNDSYHVISKLKIFTNTNTLQIDYKNFKQDFYVITLNDNTVFKVESSPYKIKQNWYYYNLYGEVERYFNSIMDTKHRIFELRTNIPLQSLITPNNKNNNKIFIITLYDSSEVHLKF